MFEDVADILLGLVPPELGEVRYRAQRWAIKVWFGPAKPTREHYEAQVMGADEVRGATVLALEVGFHTEYSKDGDNDAVIAHLVANKRRWQRAIGTEAEVGAFLGRQDAWRRVSETWPDPDLGAPDLGFEIAARLVDYIAALEPVLRTRPRSSAKH